MKMNVKELAKEQEAYVIACRRHLHEHPELSTQEVETTKFIKAELTKMGNWKKWAWKYRNLKGSQAV